ncbi:MAG: tetratricopeptide repeat protein [Candidatus Aminicenantes bacterium]|nr:tetratricopeptide repeat protein [Candidatus Aminicenantes bacterium]
MGKTGATEERPGARPRLRAAGLSLLAWGVFILSLSARGSDRRPVPDVSSDLGVMAWLEEQKDFGDPAAARMVLEDLSAKVLQKARPRARYTKPQAVRALQTIGRVLEEDGGFVYGRNNLLIAGLCVPKEKKRQIDCDDYSALYLVLGRRLGLPLQPVYAPNHVFLVCRPDARTSFYWEATTGEERDLAFFRTWLHIHPDSGFPKVLDEREFEAIALSNLGTAWQEREEHERAIACYARAIEADPGYAAAFNNLGVAYAKTCRWREAVEKYEQASRLDAHYAAPLFNLGIAFYRLGDTRRAVEQFKKVLRQDPAFGRAEQDEILAMMDKGQNARAIGLLAKLYNPR